MAKDTLAEFLASQIKKRLRDLETKKGRAAVKKELVEGTLNPTSDATAAAWKSAANKANDYVTALAQELPKHGIYPWVHPFLSAAASETIFLACAHCWLMAKPAGGGALPPNVEEYIRWQAAGFAAAVGADRS